MTDALHSTIRQAQQRYYGKFRGFVADNRDPEQRGRLKVRVPSVFGQEESWWALPCLPFGGLADQGLFMVPEAGAQVWIEFEEGNKDFPIWTGVFWQPGREIPEEARHEAPTTRMLKTPAGHRWQFDDAEGQRRLLLHHPAGSELEIDDQGSVELSAANGCRLTLDAEGDALTLEDASGNVMVMDAQGTRVTDVHGNEITMEGAQLAIKGQRIVIEGSQVSLGGGGQEPLIKGSSFLSLFATHVHTCGSPGSPTSPPIPQGEMSTLTTHTTAG
ncbi:phage baseplate assembly protein V [Halomonas sp. C05BenzN]|uniref:phage baseplate assembly protein V n=1 Tax=Halomonas sp. C05BenzN TaxID=3411041 RepID=UPI003B940364